MVPRVFYDLSPGLNISAIKNPIVTAVEIPAAVAVRPPETAPIKPYCATAFSTPLDDPWTIHLERRENTDIGCEQFIKISLEWLLLTLLRNGGEKHSSAPVSLIKENSQNEVFNKIVKYMEDNLDKQLMLSEICRDNLVGRSYLQKLFRGAMQMPFIKPQEPKQEDVKNAKKKISAVPKSFIRARHPQIKTE